MSRWHRGRWCAPLLIILANSLAGAADKPADAPAKSSSQQSAQPQPLPEGVKADRNLEYARPDGKPLLLDLFRPESHDGKLPVVVWIHGGGWAQGSKENCPLTWLAASGFAVASIEYRLTDVARWPAQIDDCRAAVRWVRSNAAKYQFDAERIGVSGASAGGHLVAMLGTIDPPVDEPISSRVRAVCDLFGPSDLLSQPTNVPGPDKTDADLAKTNAAKLLGGILRDIPDKAKSASPLYHVSHEDVPFLIIHGDKDERVPLDQSQRLHAKLKAAGVSSTLHVVAGAGHGGKEFNTPEVRGKILAFFQKQLGNEAE